MGAASNIEWCDDTFNGWTGCQKAGPGCDHCYAEAMAARWGELGHWGPGRPRKLHSDATWKNPNTWNREAARWDRPRLVFCGSRKDWADNAVPPEWRHRLWDLIRATPHLFWILVSKRVGNIPAMLPDDWGDGYPNVAIIITVCTQREVERDIPRLVAIPAVVRGLSLEPLLEDVDLTPWMAPVHVHHHPANDTGSPAVQALVAAAATDLAYRTTKLHWAIVGGESGPQARVYPWTRARSVIGQCAKAHIACFNKQVGRRPAASAGGQIIRLKDKKGGDPDEWPADLRVRQFPPQFRHPQSIGRLTAAPPTAYLFGSGR